MTFDETSVVHRADLCPRLIFFRQLTSDSGVIENGQHPPPSSLPGSANRPPGRVTTCLVPKPSTLNRKSKTQTLDPRTRTLNPKPKTLNRRGGRRRKTTLGGAPSGRRGGGGGVCGGRRDCGRGQTTAVIGGQRYRADTVCRADANLVDTGEDTVGGWGGTIHRFIDEWCLGRATFIKLHARIRLMVRAGRDPVRLIWPRDDQPFERMNPKFLKLDPKPRTPEPQPITSEPKPLTPNPRPTTPTHRPKKQRPGFRV